MKTTPFSRRQFLAWCSALPVLSSQQENAFELPLSFKKILTDSSARYAEDAAPRLTDNFIKPHYRSPSPLSGILDKVDPAKDIYPSEATAAQINRILLTWREALMSSRTNWEVIGNSLASDFSGSSLKPAKETVRRNDVAFKILDLAFDSASALGKADFLAGLSARFSNVQFLWAEFKLTTVDSGASGLATTVRYDLVDTGEGYHRRQRVGSMKLAWQRGQNNEWQVTEWRLASETCSQSHAPIFEEITEEALGANDSFRRQLSHGVDYWRTILDGASGIDIYGNFGVAAGDIDGDGWDDLYICQPAGLPNRLYRNRGDGTFEDVTERAGVGVIDSSPSALFADIDNDGRQDLIVVRGNGPLLFLNQGDGTFRLKEDAFKFAQAAQGTFTGAALADYDRDGWLDIYFCLYSYYQGPDRYRYPLPYYSAENGPPNFLFHNNHDGTFIDVTRATGLHHNNNRFSFACGWCDYDGDGWPDLFVTNDGAYNFLFHNLHNGTFEEIGLPSGTASGADGQVYGNMAADFGDFDRDGKLDLFVTRYGRQPASLFWNQGHDEFVDLAYKTGLAAKTFWPVKWGTGFGDFDNDGWPDIFIASGNFSSLLDGLPDEPPYKEPLQLYRNDGGHSFQEIADASGLNAGPLQSRRGTAFGDVNNDGNLDVLVFNVAGPPSLFLNETKSRNHRILLHLIGAKSNKMAIGARVTVTTEDATQIDEVRGGGSYLSSNDTRVHFGVGKSTLIKNLEVRWPSGLTQNFQALSPDAIYEITEGQNIRKTAPLPAP